MNHIEFKTIRIKLGLTQDAMARKLLVSGQRTIRKWETGERKIPGPVAVALYSILRESHISETFS